MNKVYVRRSKYVEQVQPFIRQPLIKVLTGQRRVGKSYLLFQLMDTIQLSDDSANIIYISCEDIDFDFLDTAKALHNYVTEQLTSGNNYVFIDEIQEIPEFERAIRSLLLKEKVDIYITGSNANLLSGELATMLSGRYIEFQVFGLSYNEFLTFHQLESNQSAYENYAKYGGLPYLKHLELKDSLVNEYLSSIYNTILYRDVVSRYNVRNSDFLERLVRFLADNVGSPFSAKKISDYLKSQKVNISVNLVQNFIAHLKSAFIIEEVDRYDIKGKRIFEIGNKYYFSDLGLRNVIAGYRISDRAKLLENLVYNHLRYCGYKVYVGALQQYEIDFVCERNGEKLYVQVALHLSEQTTIEREFGNLLKIEDNYPKIVVSEDTFEGNSFEGILHIPILEFLQNDQ